MKESRTGKRPIYAVAATVILAAVLAAGTMFAGCGSSEEEDGEESMSNTENLAEATDNGETTDGTDAEENTTTASLAEDSGTATSLSIPIQTASGRDETYAWELDGEWLFGGRALSEAAALASDRSGWESVTIPHTWNAEDADDGGSDYDRTFYWYYKEFTIDESLQDKQIYIEFLGANTKTDLYVNGVKVGETHEGGYTAFRYNITDYLSEDGNNYIYVKVDNTLDQDIAPISADFNMYGGIYRRVYLIAVDEVHVDLESYGSSGLYLTTGYMRSLEEPEDLGEFNVQADLVNASDAAQTVTVTVTVEGDNAPEAFSEEITIAADSTYEFSKDLKVEDPTLWEGIDYSKNADNTNAGYQYTVTLTVTDSDGEVIDEVSDKLGFRYFYVDEDEGFYLNGEKYTLHGVNRHSFLAGSGSAMTEEDHYADMQIMLELGITCVRLCHYPQTDYFYDLCDAYGIVVWTEIPLVNAIGTGSDFEEVTKNQLTELISQQYNRPSIIFWGLENEIGNGTSLTNATSSTAVSGAKALLYELDGLAHELDTTGRYTTQALNRDYAMDQNDADSVNEDFENNIGWKSDLIAWNIYPGWYSDENFYGTFEDVMTRKIALDSRSMGISEYGWGANVNQHEAYPELGENGLSAGGAWHPEEYQSLMNEEAIAYINEHDELWATFYWAMFDFAVDSRSEGSQVALNDKGLVTADRETKKDSYYLYKANWNQADSFAYITSRRWTDRTEGETYIKVYSNCDAVELFVNGESLGMMEAQGNGVFLTEGVNLEIGEATISVIGTCEGDDAEYTDSCTWTVSEELEDLALNKTVYASSEEGTASDGATTTADMAVDGSVGSRWVAQTQDTSGNWDAQYPEWLCVDLGEVCDITSLELLLESKNDRTYEYEIWVSEDVSPEGEGTDFDPESAGYTKVYATDGNETSGQQETLELDGVSARYVLVRITSCSLYSSSAKYVAASIYELEIYGAVQE
ncbi:MAG: discoidin domain-containing protein [Lachnospiraceae bacterium]|nr:discoidin domain-containing protein [Lachnospiraceae bacterium]